MEANKEKNRKKTSLVVAFLALIVVISLVLMLFKPPFLVMSPTSRTSTTKTIHVVTSETKTTQFPKVHVTGITTLPATITGKKVEFKIKSISVIDRNFYPTLKINFESNVYPLEFMFYRVKGEEVEWAGEVIAEEPQTVMYKKVGDRLENIRAPLKLILSVRYQGIEIYTKNITIQGVKPVIQNMNIVPPWCNEDPSRGYELIIDVKNEGDSPLYVRRVHHPEECKYLKIAFDNKECMITLEKDYTVNPQESMNIKVLVRHGMDISPFKEHTIKVILFNVSYELTIPKIDSKVLNLIVKEVRVTSHNVTGKILTLKLKAINNWVIPILLDPYEGWLKIKINNASAIFNPLVYSINVNKRTLDFGENDLSITIHSEYEKGIVEISIGEAKIKTTF